MSVFSKSEPFHVFSVLREFSTSYRRHFQSGKAFNALNKFPTLFRNFETRRNFYEADFGQTHKWKISKNRFFRNSLKYDLNVFRYRIQVQNCSKTPRESISCHISSSRPIPDTSWKIEFFAKIAISMNFCLSQYGRLYGRAGSKYWINLKNMFFET